MWQRLGRLLAIMLHTLQSSVSIRSLADGVPFLMLRPWTAQYLERLAENTRVAIYKHRGFVHIDTARRSVKPSDLHSGMKPWSLPPTIAASEGSS